MGRPQSGWRILGVRERMRVPRPAARTTAAVRLDGSVRDAVTGAFSGGMARLEVAAHPLRLGFDATAHELARGRVEAHLAGAEDEVVGGDGLAVRADGAWSCSRADGSTGHALVLPCPPSMVVAATNGA